MGLIVLGIVVFIAGFIAGYFARTVVSWRRQAARERLRAPV